jgi:hypothetical protein
MNAIWVWLKRTLGSLALALALFLCLRVGRIFIAGDIVELFVPLSGRVAVAWIAIVAGVVSALPLGLAYGLLRARSVLAGAIIVAVLACALELATSSVVSWWRFVTWWVLPLECFSAFAVFVAAALAGSRLLPSVRPVVRFRLGVAVFAVITVGVVAWSWFLQQRPS